MKHRYIILIALGAIVGGCANRGIGPQGGPKDETPPKILKETPENGSLGIKPKKIEIQFSEYIQLDDVSNQVLVSPPQQYPPDIKGLGKKVRIEFKEELKDSTTYTIDFGSAIVDNTEKNPLKGYAYSFSTGDKIDSLEIYGTILNAENLNPISGVIIGYHSNLEDSAFSTTPFERIGRSDKEGEFSIKNIPHGTYRLYGLHDMSRDYIYQLSEGLAFYDSLITPYIHIEAEHDTIWLKDTLAADSSLIPDSVITTEYVYYEPSNIVMYFFREDTKRHYFQRAQRDKAHFFRLIFSAPQDSLPMVEAMRLESDSLGRDTTWVNFLDYALLQSNRTKDTLTYWLTDSSAIRMDSIRFRMTYMATDSLYKLYARTDTVMAVYREPNMTERARANMLKKEANTPLLYEINNKKPLEIYDTLKIISKTPLRRITPDSIHLEVKVDTLWKKVNFTIQRMDSAGMVYGLIAPLKGTERYQIRLDSAALEDIYGKANTKAQSGVNIRKKEEYSTLKVYLKDYDERAYIVLLDEKDQPVRTLHAERDGTVFENLVPKVYYMRLFLDLDGNGQWTTGEWATKRQPEPVYYSRKKLSLRANWDFEDTFDWKSLPQFQQKPNELKKDANEKKK